MSLTDPQSITISGTPITLPRVSVGRLSSEYKSADGLVTFKMSSSEGNRIRRVARIDHKKISADVYLPDRNVERSMSCYLVFDLPPVGYTNADALAVYQGFKAQITASSDAIVSKLLGGES